MEIKKVIRVHVLPGSSPLIRAMFLGPRPRAFQFSAPERKLVLSLHPRLGKAKTHLSDNGVREAN